MSRAALLVAIACCLAVVSGGSAAAVETLAITAPDGSAYEPGYDKGRIVIARQTAAATPLTVIYTLTGAATNGADYVQLPTTATIPAGAISVDVLVQPLDDATAEVPEGATVTLQTDAAYALGAVRSATVTIRDDEPATVTILATDAKTTEPGTDAGGFRVTRAGDLSAAITVALSYTGSAGLGSDVATLPPTVAIASGASVVEFAVTALEDAQAEPQEAVVARVEPAAGYVVGAAAQATVAVADDEPAGVVLSIADATMYEPGDPGRFQIDRVGSTSGAITVTYAMSGTATNGTDFQALSGSLAIAANVLSAQVTATPVNDAIAEGEEAVVLTLQPGSYAIVGPASATLTLVDNEPTVSVAVDPAYDAIACEGFGTNGGRFLVSRTGAPNSFGSALTVSFSVGGTASAGDFATIGTSAVIPAGLSAVAVAVTPTDDADVEAAETVTMAILANATYAIGTVGAGTVTIVDDDALLPVVSLAATDTTATEEGDPGEVVFTRTGPTSDPLEVAYLVMGSAAGGSDYAALPGTITIPAGQTSAAIAVVPSQDALRETTETVEIRVAESSTLRIGGLPWIASVAIADDDAAEVSISVPDNTASEPGAGLGNGVFRLTRTGSTAVDLAVRIAVTGDAQAGADYAALAEWTTIPAGSSTATIDVVAIDDAAVEASEGVTVTVVTAAGYEVAAAASATLSVRDDEAPVVSIAIADATASEPGTDLARLTVSRLGSLGAALTIPVATSGVATSGSDYQALATTVALAAGTASTTIDVKPLADTAAEGDENVIVTLGAGAGYALDATSSATLVIADDDVAPVASIGTAPVAGAEQAATVLVPVVLSSTPRVPVTVAYVLSGTANGRDYSHPGGTVAFAPGETAKSIALAIADDIVVEPDETIVLTLSSGVGVTIGNPSSATYTIEANDTTAAGTASFTAVDAVTRGDWTWQYGADGYVIANGPSSLPAYVSLLQEGLLFTWAASTTDARALEPVSGGSRFVASRYAYDTMEFALDVGAQPRQLALYCVDWERVNRQQRIEILDGATGTVYDSRDISAFGDGVWLVYQVSGAVRIRATLTGGINTVLSAVCLGGPRRTFTTGSATFVTTDTSTQGTWRQVYGSDGYSISGDSRSLPGYASLIEQSHVSVWQNPSTDVRALEKGVPGTRIAAVRETYASYTDSIDLGPSARRVAFYMIDWERVGRAQRVEILDGLTGTVLDTREVTNFREGVHLVYDLAGFVRVRTTKTAGPNGGLSGIFFGPVPANQPPSFVKGADISRLEDAGPQTVAAWATSITAVESGQSVAFTVTPDVAGLFSAGPAIAADGTLTFTPAANANGIAALTVLAQDNGGTANGGDDTSAPQTFTITLTPVNDAPTFAMGADQVVLEDASARTLAGWATAISGGPGDGAQQVSFTVTTDDPGLFAAGPAVAADGTLTFTTAADANGIALVTITAQDDGGAANGGVDTSAEQTFTIEVTAVNDAPSFVKGADQAIAVNTGAQSVTGWATAISAGPSDESGQSLHFEVAVDHPELFASAPTVDVNGTLAYHPGSVGTAVVSVRLVDDGGTAGGGDDQSAVQVFSIVIESALQQAWVEVVDGIAKEGGISTVMPYASSISSQPGGPGFAWVELRSIPAATDIELAEHQRHGPFPIGFSFPFYGRNVSEFWVATNGFISFSATDASATGSSAALPSVSSPHDIIAVFWKQLSATSSGGGPGGPGGGATGKARYGVVDGRLVVQYIGMYDPSLPPFGTFDFQVILAPDGEITCQYLQVPFPFGGAIAGIQDETGLRGLTAATGTGSPSAMEAIRFRANTLPGDDALFRIHRQGASLPPVSIAYTVTGTAASNGDYNALAGTAAMAEGQSELDVVVHPLADAIAEVDETVTVSLVTTVEVTAIAPVAGTVKIHDADRQYPTGPSPYFILRPVAAQQPVTGTSVAVTCQADDDGGESGLIYTWTSQSNAIEIVPNGTNAAQTAIASFQGAGTYLVTLTVTDADQHAASADVVIEVVQTPTDIVTWTTGTVVNPGGTVYVGASVYDQFGDWTGDDVTWTATGGTIDEDGVFIAGSVAGLFEVVAHAGDVASDPVVIRVNGPPAITVAPTPAQAQVTGTRTEITVSALDDVDGGNVTYVWSQVDEGPEVGFSVNRLPSADTTLATFTQAGHYEFTLTVTDSMGLSTTVPLSLDVVATPSLLTILQSAADPIARTRTFTAAVFDQFERPIQPAPSVAWGVVGPASITPAGVMNEGSTAGPITVIADAGGASATFAVDSDGGGTGEPDPDAEVPEVTLTISDGLTGKQRGIRDGVQLHYTKNEQVEATVSLSVAVANVARVLIVTSEGAQHELPGAGSVDIPIGTGVITIEAIVELTDDSTLPIRPTVTLLSDRTAPELEFYLADKYVTDPEQYGTMPLRHSATDDAGLIFLNGASEGTNTEMRAGSASIGRAAGDGINAFQQSGFLLSAHVIDEAGLLDSHATATPESGSTLDLTAVPKAPLLPDGYDRLQVNAFESLPESVVIDAATLRISEFRGRYTANLTVVDRCGNEVTLAPMKLWVDVTPPQAKLGRMPYPFTDTSSFTIAAGLPVTGRFVVTPFDAAVGWQYSGLQKRSVRRTVGRTSELPRATADSALGSWILPRGIAPDGSGESHACQFVDVAGNISAIVPLEPELAVVPHPSPVPYRWGEIMRENFSSELVPPGEDVPGYPSGKLLWGRKWGIEPIFKELVSHQPIVNDRLSVAYPFYVDQIQAGGERGYVDVEVSPIYRLAMKDSVHGTTAHTENRYGWRWVPGSGEIMGPATNPPYVSIARGVGIGNFYVPYLAHEAPYPGYGNPPSWTTTPEPPGPTGLWWEDVFTNGILHGNAIPGLVANQFVEPSGPFVPGPISVPPSWETDPEPWKIRVKPHHGLGAFDVIPAYPSPTNLTLGVRWQRAGLHEAAIDHGVSMPPTAVSAPWPHNFFDIFDPSDYYEFQLPRSRATMAAGAARMRFSGVSTESPIISFTYEAGFGFANVVKLSPDVVCQGTPTTITIEACFDATSSFYTIPASVRFLVGGIDRTMTADEYAQLNDPSEANGKIVISAIRRHRAQVDADTRQALELDLIVGSEVPSGIYDVDVKCGRVKGYSDELSQLTAGANGAHRMKGALAILPLSLEGGVRFGSIHKATVVPLPGAPVDFKKKLGATHLFFPKDCLIDSSANQNYGLIKAGGADVLPDSAVVALVADDGTPCRGVTEFFQSIDSLISAINFINAIFGFPAVTADGLKQDLVVAFGIPQNEVTKKLWWLTPTYTSPGKKSPIRLKVNGQPVGDPIVIMVKQPMWIEPATTSVARFEKFEAIIHLDDDYFHHAGRTGLSKTDVFDAYDADKNGEKIIVDARFRLMSGGADEEGSVVTIDGKQQVYDVPCFLMKDAAPATPVWKVRFSPPYETTGTQFWEVSVRAGVWHMVKADVPGNYDEFNQGGPQSAYYHYYGYNDDADAPTFPAAGNQHKVDGKFYAAVDPLSGQKYDAILPKPRFKLKVTAGTKSGPLSVGGPNPRYFHYLAPTAGGYSDKPFFVLGGARPWSVPSHGPVTSWGGVEGISRHTDLYPKMVAAGMNFNYTWFAPWETQMLHRKQAEFWYHGEVPAAVPVPVGAWRAELYYDQGRAKRMDEIVEGHEANNLYMAITVWAHQSLQASGHPWNETGWNSKPKDQEENGLSALMTNTEFFASAADETSSNWLYQKDYYRYIVARYGYSRAVAMWVTIDELEGVGNSKTFWFDNLATTNRWHDSLLKTVKELDYRKRPTTASTTYWGMTSDPYNEAGDGPDTEELDGHNHGGWNGGLQQPEVLSLHTYHNVYHPTAYGAEDHLWVNGGTEIWQDIPDQQALLWHYLVARMHTWPSNTAALGKPNLVTEFGFIERTNPTDPIPTSQIRSYFHYALWSAFANGHAGTPLKWCDGKEFGELFPRGGAAYGTYPDLGHEMSALVSLVTSRIDLSQLTQRISGMTVTAPDGSPSPVRAFGLSGGGKAVIWLFDDDFDHNWGVDWGRSVRTYANDQRASKHDHLLAIPGFSGGSIKRYGTWDGTETADPPGTVVGGALRVPVGSFSVAPNPGTAWDGADVVLIIE